jgi:uncharacterized membrane protein
MTRIVKTSAWLLMLLLASVIALVSLRFFVLPMKEAAAPQFAGKFADHLVIFLAHAAGGPLALLIGPWQFWSAFRNRFLTLHRWMGRVYLFAILIGGLAGLYLARIAFGGLPAQIGFGALAVLWLATGVMAYLAIRRGQIESHREWMIRSYALTLAAVTLRLWLPLFQSLHIKFLAAYITVAWLSWVPNLLVAELWIRWARRKKQLARTSPQIAKSVAG